MMRPFTARVTFAAIHPAEQGSGTCLGPIHLLLRGSESTQVLLHVHAAMLFLPLARPQKASARHSTQRRSRRSGVSLGRQLQTAIEKPRRECAQPTFSRSRGYIPARAGRILHPQPDPRNRSSATAAGIARRSGAPFLRSGRRSAWIAGLPNPQIQCESAPAASSGAAPGRSRKRA